MELAPSGITSYNILIIRNVEMHTAPKVVTKSSLLRNPDMCFKDINLKIISMPNSLLIVVIPYRLIFYNTNLLDM